MLNKMPAAGVEKTVSARKLLLPGWYTLILIALLGCGLVLWRQKSMHIIYADKQPLIVELSETSEQQALGLSGRKSLPNGHGMLFTFVPPSNACMWMKDMKFDIDVYWYSATGNIISSRTNTKPESYPAVYCPEIRASYMLEVNDGQFSKVPKHLALPLNQ